MVESEKTKVMAGFAWKFLERILSQGVTFVVSVILARLLLPEEYGTIAMLQIFIVIANVFISAGFASSLIQKKDADDLDFSTMFYCSMVMSVVLYIVIYVCAPFIAEFYNLPDLTNVMRVYALSLIISGYNCIQHAWVSRHMVFRKFFYSTFSSALCSGVIGIIMAYMGYGVWALVAQSLSNIFINTIVMRSIITWRPQLNFSKERARNLVDYGSKIMVANLLGTLCNEIRQLLIGKFYSPADLAFFNRGKQLPHLATTNIDNTINTVLFPAMSNHGDNPSKVYELTRKSICTSSYIMFLIMGILFVTAYPFTEILLTKKWLPCVPYYQLMCISGMVATVSNTNLQAIKALGRSDVALKLELYKKPMFILMLIVGVKISVYALACTMPLYALYAAFVNMSANKKLMNYGIKDQLRDYMPASVLFIAMILVAYPINYLCINIYCKFLIQIFVSTFVYIGLSIVFKVGSYYYIKSTILEILFQKKGK